MVLHVNNGSHFFLQREQLADWKPGEIKIPQFHCARCRDYWLRHGRLPDECPEERRRRLAMEAEEARKKSLSAWRLRRRKRQGASDEFGDSCSDDEFGGNGGGGGRRSRRHKNGGGGLGEDGDSDSLMSGRGRRGGNSGGGEGMDDGEGGLKFGAGRGGYGGAGGDGSRGGHSGLDDPDGSGGMHRSNSFIGADGKRYVGGNVDGDYSIGGIPAFGDRTGKNGGADGLDGSGGLGLGSGQGGDLIGLGGRKPSAGSKNQHSGGGEGGGLFRNNGMAGENDTVQFGRRRGSRRGSVDGTNLLDQFGTALGENDHDSLRVQEVRLATAGVRVMVTMTTMTTPREDGDLIADGGEVLMTMAHTTATHHPSPVDDRIRKTKRKD